MRIERPKILERFRGRGLCDFCRRDCRHRETAHVLARGMGGGNRLDISPNLVSLGGPFDCTCHARSHAGQRPRPHDLLAIVARRYGILAEDVLDVLRFFQRLEKGASTIKFHERAKTELGAYSPAYDLAAATWLEIKSEPEPKRRKCSLGARKKVRR